MPVHGPSPDEVFLADLSGARGSQTLPDLAFLRRGGGRIPALHAPEDDGPPRRADGARRHPWAGSKPTSPANRLLHFAHAVRPFDWGDDPRMAGWRRDLEAWVAGGPEDSVQGKTQDLWDLLFAIHRADRFSEGTVATNLVALTRIARRDPPPPAHLQGRPETPRRRNRWVLRSIIPFTGEERPSGDQGPRPRRRQRPLPALRLRPPADDLRGGLHRPRPWPAAPGGLPDPRRIAEGRAGPDPQAQPPRDRHRSPGRPRSPPWPSGSAASGPIRRWD